MSLVIIKGTPAIAWGTAGTIGGAGIGGSVIDSLQLTPKNAEPIDIEGGDGTSTNLVLLRDGFNAKVTVMYDSGKSYPIEGANANVTIGYAGAGANSIPFGEGAGASYTNGAVVYTCLVASVSPAYKKKGEYMLDFALVYRPNVAV